MSTAALVNTRREEIQANQEICTTYTGLNIKAVVLRTHLSEGQ